MKLVTFLLSILLLIACQSDPVIPEAPTAMLLTGEIIPNPLYNIEEGEDRNPYIISNTNWPDSVAHNIGVYIEERGIVQFASCEYVFASERLGDMMLWGGGACVEYRVAPYEVYVASERIQFLLLESGDLFWDCWELEGLGSSGVVAGFAVFVRPNEAH